VLADRSELLTIIYLRRNVPAEINHQGELLEMKLRYKAGFGIVLIVMMSSFMYWHHADSEHVTHTEWKFKQTFDVCLYPHNQPELDAIQPIILGKVYELHQGIIQQQNRLNTVRDYAEKLPYGSAEEIVLRVATFHECEQSLAQLKVAEEYLRQVGEMANNVGYSIADLEACGWTPPKDPWYKRLMREL